MWKNPRPGHEGGIGMSCKLLRVRYLFVCGILSLALWSGGQSFGQAADGNLIGSVLDATGAAVPNARVEAENVATGVKTAAITDATGSYRFNNLLVGAYKITGSAAGLAPFASTVTVELNQTFTINLILAVGGVTQEVRVTEAPALIDTTTAQITNSYSERILADLPLAANPVGGGIYNLSLTGGGVASSGGVGVGYGPSIGGQRPRNNNFTIEGVDDNRKDVTGPIMDLPIDAIQEFSVLQNQFSAEFGHSSGGQFNAVLVAGTNEIHGRLYEYFQNRNLNAVDQAAKRQGTLTKPRFDQNILGGEVGGPIRTNKLFYFGAFDYNPLGQQSVPSSGRFAPTAAGFATLAAIPGISATNLGVLKQYLTPATAATKTAVICPAGSPVVCQIGPNQPGIAIPLGPLAILAPNYTNEYRWVGSVDYHMSDRNQWRARYIDNRVRGIDSAPQLPVFFQPRPTRKLLASIAQFHTFSPSLSNELRMGYNRYHDELSAGDFKFPGLDAFPNITVQGDLNLNIGPNPSAPNLTIQNTYQLSDNVSWFKGRHAVRFGFDGRNQISESTFISSIRGAYNYSNLDRFLRDLTPDALATRSVNAKLYSGNSYQLYFYGSDNWKVTRNLALDLGLRYEFSSVPRSMQEFELNKIADVPGVLTFAAPRPDKRNFAPRIGLAYSPGDHATTSIRAGFGMAYDLIFDNVGTTIRPPQASSLITETNKDNNPGYLANGGIPSTVPQALTAADFRRLTTGYLPDQKLGYAINWNLGVQHSFGKDYTAEVRYLGTRGDHLLLQTQINRNAVVTASRNLPLFFSQPAQAALDALPLTLGQLTAERDSASGNPYLPYGFSNIISAYRPQGNSVYHGMAIDINKRFSQNMLFKAGYTWSHMMDDSTADINSTTLSPRRPEDFNNIRKEWASSALDRRHRLSVAWEYEMPVPGFAKKASAAYQNVMGNWKFSGVYFYESPEYVTPQSVFDANLNGDAQTDRVVINTAGSPNVSSDITPLMSVRAGTSQTVGYLVTTPNAYYIRARPGVYTNSGRNTLRTRPIDNFDLNIAKAVRFKESYAVEFRVDMYNAFNHPQYVPGRTDRVSATGHGGETNYLTPGQSSFGQWDQAFSSNPRQLQFTAKVKF
jgi:hypothetical protein